MTQPSSSSTLFLLIFSFALALSSFTLQAQDVPDYQHAPVVPTLSQFQLEKVRVPIRAEQAIPRISASPQAVGATFNVTTTNDTGTGSFRKAINDANASSGRDIIEFNIPGSGYKTISPTSPLPYIVDPVVIDATTQSGVRIST
ncbi:MAG: hypothetical protein Q8K98_00725 [Bacteroidota bacterium]|nr:hypothetical protein [Bacteroidota bacterium]